MGLRNIFGTGVATLGQLLDLPERGWSETITGQTQQTSPLIGTPQQGWGGPSYNSSTGGGGSWGGDVKGLQQSGQIQQPQPSSGGGGGGGGGDTSYGDRLAMWRAQGETGDLPVGWNGPGGGGGSGGGEPSIDYNALFAPAFEAYSQYEKTLKGRQSGIIEGIESSGKEQVSGLEAEQAKRMGTFEGQETEAKNVAGEGMQDIRREQAEIQKGIQARFGGTTGTGGFASEILGSQTMRQMGKQRVALQNTLSEIDKSRENLKSDVMTQISKVNLQTQQLKASARNEFEMNMEKINLAKGELEIRKAEHRIDALNNYQNTLAELKAQEQEFKQRLLTADAQGNAYLTAFQNKAYQDFQAEQYSLGASPMKDVQMASTHQPTTTTIRGTNEEENEWDEILKAIGGV